jgi:hypothetical protein
MVSSLRRRRSALEALSPMTPSAQIRYHPRGSRMPQLRRFRPRICRRPRRIHETHPSHSWPIEAWVCLAQDDAISTSRIVCRIHGWTLTVSNRLLLFALRHRYRRRSRWRRAARRLAVMRVHVEEYPAPESPKQISLASSTAQVSFTMCSKIEVLIRRASTWKHLGRYHRARAP